MILPATGEPAIARTRSPGGRPSRSDRRRRRAGISSRDVPASFARPELSADPDWVAENLGRPGVRVLDCRWRVDGSGRELHAVGHVPSAAFLDWTVELVDRSDRLPFQLAGPEAVSAALSTLGV